MSLAPLLDRALVLLLAIALAASGGLSMSMARDDAAVGATTDLSAGEALSHCGMAHWRPAGQVSLAGHGDGREATCADAPGPKDRHHHVPAHCSLCLIAGAFVDMPGLGLPALTVVWHPLPWIGPATRSPPEAHARAPPARGPPVPVLLT